MSRIGAPVRFNMPFELGLACSLKLRDPNQYDILVFDSKPYHMDRRLSDYKGRDLYIHRGTRSGMISALLDAFHPRRIDESRLRNALHDLSVSTDRMKRDANTSTVFHPYAFGTLFDNATHIAADYGFVPA